MGILEAVKKGFSMSGKLMKVVLIFFILNTIMGLISLPLASPENAGNTGIAAVSIAISIVFFAIFIFLQGGALGLARDTHKTGTADMGNFSAYGKKYYVRILGLLLLYILIAVGIVLILALIGSGILAIGDSAFTRTLIGVIAALIAFAAITVLLFPIYSIVADDNSIMAALKKGIKIGRENFLRVFGLFLTLVIVSIVISIVVGFLIGIVTVPLPFKVTQILITIINSAVQSYIPIVMMLSLMGFYLGLSNTSGSGNTQQ
ncbi:MAG: hypothetical protein ABIH57_03385 [Candidatus Omnitrophota bacterium]